MEKTSTNCAPATDADDASPGDGARPEEVAEPPPADESARGDDLSARRFAAGLGAILMLAFYLRGFGRSPDGLAGLDFFGLWYDETFSGWIALKPWREMLWAAGKDVHPPLFYILLKLWYALVPSLKADPAWTRWLPTLLGLACVPATAALGAAVFSLRVGLLAALLLAVAPYHVLYSHEARMYSLGCLTLTLQTVFLWRLARRPNLRDGVLYCVFAALSLYSHYYMMMILLGHTAYFAAARALAGERPLVWLRQGALVALGILLLYLPWFGTFLQHSMNNTFMGIHAFGGHVGKAEVVQYLFEWTLGTHPSFFFEIPGKAASPFIKTMATGALLYGLLAGAFVHLWRRRPEAARFGVGVILIPAALTALYLLTRGRFFARCAVFYMPVLLCFISVGLLAMPKPLYRIVALAFILVGFLASSERYLHDGLFRDKHHLAHKVLVQAPDAGIVCSRPFDFIPTAFYDYPRDRTRLLNTSRLSFIQRVMMGRERIVMGRDELPETARLFLVVSEWDFQPLDQRLAAQEATIEAFEERWLQGDYVQQGAWLWFPPTPKWVYAGLYRRLH